MVHFYFSIYTGNTEIKGGIVVTYRDATNNYGAIEIFTPFLELNSVLRKVLNRSEFNTMSEVVITRTAFLMAYGDDNTTLENFDEIIPDEVFREVTSISPEQFRLLRDGGDYTDQETGEVKHYHGNLFDPVVFDDSVKEFLSLKKRLADYFDETHTEDIFDYIPPQRTNQIYTPKKIVIKMVDMFETENPGCTSPRSLSVFTTAKV